MVAFTTCWTHGFAFEGFYSHGLCPIGRIEKLESLVFSYFPGKS